MASEPQRGVKPLTRMSIDRLFALGTTPIVLKKQALQDMNKLMEAVAHAKDAVKASPPSAADDNLALKRLILDTDATCYRFQTLDAVLLEAVQQAKPFCVQLASVLEKQREETREFVVSFPDLIFAPCAVAGVSCLTLYTNAHTHLVRPG